MSKRYSIRAQLSRMDTACSQESDQPDTPRSRICRLIKSYAFRISMAGLYDVLIAPVGLTKAFWILSLVTCHIAFLYASGNLVSAYIQKSDRFKAETNLQQKSAESLPFPNVTICAPSQIDVNMARECLYIPPDVAAYAAKRFGSRQELIEAFFVYVAFSTNEKPQVEERDYRYMDRIWEQNALVDRTTGQCPTYRGFISHHTLNCSQMVEWCTFDGEPFNCCENAVKVIADDAMCFTFNMEQKTQRVNTEASQKSGLHIDVGANWRNVLPTYTDMTDGFMVQTSGVYTAFADAVGVPNGMQVTIRLTPTKKDLAFKCLRHSDPIPTLKYFSFYDSHGYNCHLESFLEIVTLHFLNCLLPYGGIIPNGTNACSSQQGRILHDTFYGKFDGYTKELISDRWTSARKGGWLKARESIRELYYSGRCLPFCSTWEYTMHIGYAALSRPREMDPYYSRSRIHIFFADDTYTQMVETPAFNYYILFSKVGALAGLYAGVSVIGVFELLAYGALIGQVWIAYKLRERTENEEKEERSESSKRRIFKRSDTTTSGPYRQDTVTSIRI